MTSEKQNEHGNQFHTEVTVVTRRLFLRLPDLKYSRIQDKSGVKPELVIKVGNELHYIHDYYSVTITSSVQKKHHWVILFIDVLVGNSKESKSCYSLPGPPEDSDFLRLRLLNILV